MSIKIKRQRKVMRKKYDQEGITETVNTVTVREKKNHPLLLETREGHRIPRRMIFENVL